MKSVRVLAENVKVGDRFDGRIVLLKMPSTVRSGRGVSIITRKPHGYGLDVFTFAAAEKVGVKRPGYNLVSR